MFTDDHETRTVLKTLGCVLGGVGLFKLGKGIGRDNGYAEGYQRCQLEELQRLRKENSLRNKG